MTTDPKPEQVRRILEISTSHLREADAELLEAKRHGTCDTSAMPRVIGDEYGWLVTVPDLLTDDDAGRDRARKIAAPTLHTVLTYARSIGCARVLFDADADDIDQLPVYGW